MAQKYNVPAPTRVARPNMQAWQTGAITADSIAPAMTSSYGQFPPASLTGIANADALPRYTATGSPVTLSAATPTAFPTLNPSSDVGNGWYNPSDTAGYYTAIAG